MKYSKYLTSKKWRNKRQELFQNKNRCCSFCFSEDNLHVHHSKYKDKNGSVLNREKHKILFPLCARCHAKWHYYHDKPLTERMIYRANAMFLESIPVDDCIRFCFSSKLFKVALFSWRADRDKREQYKYKKVKKTISGQR